MLILPSGLGVGDVVYFNVSILNDEAVEEMFENFTVHLNDTARVSVIGTRYAVVDIREDETDGEFEPEDLITLDRILLLLAWEILLI